MLFVSQRDNVDPSTTLALSIAQTTAHVPSSSSSDREQSATLLSTTVSSRSLHQVTTAFVVDRFPTQRSDRPTDLSVTRGVVLCCASRPLFTVAVSAAPSTDRQTPITMSSSSSVASVGRQPGPCQSTAELSYTVTRRLSPASRFSITSPVVHHCSLPFKRVIYGSDITVTFTVTVTHRNRCHRRPLRVDGWTECQCSKLQYGSGHSFSIQQVRFGSQTDRHLQM